MVEEHRRGKPRSDPEATTDGVRSATGRGRVEWFAALDAWGATDRPYREIADWLVGEHHLSNWWAQKLIVEYQQARRVRPPGIRPDGTFEVGASKTVAVPVERLIMAFVDTDTRERWLPGAPLRERLPRSTRTLRFDWHDGPSRVVVSVVATSDIRAQVVVQHERLPDADSAQQMKSFWRERLAALKAMLER